MTAIDTTHMNEKEHVVRGKVTEAKGLVQEKWGELTNDDEQRLSGRKNQIVGRLEAKYGDTWMARTNNWVLAGTAVAVLVALLAIFLSQRGSES